jgi:hypothetical protein
VNDRSFILLNSIWKEICDRLCLHSLTVGNSIVPLSRLVFYIYCTRWRAIVMKIMMKWRKILLCENSRIPKVNVHIGGIKVTVPDLSPLLSLLLFFLLQLQGGAKVSLPRKKLNISITARANGLIFFTTDKGVFIVHTYIKTSRNASLNYHLLLEYKNLTF